MGSGHMIGYTAERRPANRWVRQTKVWLSNRWHWREGRRVRAEIARLERFVVALADLPGPMVPATYRMAALLDRLPGNHVLEYGYGMAEALVISAEREPATIAPLVERVVAFDDTEILGDPTADRQRMREAVEARNELIMAMRAIVAAHLKAGSA